MVPTFRADEQPGRGEAGPLPFPIRIDPDDREEKLDPMSRVNLGTFCRIDHAMKVRSFGAVNPKSMEALQSQLRAVWGVEFGIPPALRQPAQGVPLVTDSSGAIGTNTEGTRLWNTICGTMRERGMSDAEIALVEEHIRSGGHAE